MPTAAERQALLFVAAVAVVGAGVRVNAAHRFAHGVDVAVGPVNADSGGPAARALEAQLAAVDSARAAGLSAGRRQRPPRRRSSRDTAVVSTPRRGASPPSNAAARSRVAAEHVVAEPAPPVSADNPVDLNSASADELERLPRIGPALASRIIAWRDSHGPFRSLDDLRHVPGIGVTTADRLGPLVTFSPRYRPFQSEARPSRRYPALPAI